MAREKIVVGIDVGSSKVCTLIGELGKQGRLNVIGVGVAPSRGLRRGIVVNIEEASDAIAASVAKAERVSGYKVVSAYVGITGNHVASLNNRGVVTLAGGDRPIGADDVARAIEAARLISVPSNREILHAIPRGYILDGHDGVKNPIGMLGYRLDVETHIITGAATAIENLRRCVTRLGIDVDELVLQPIACGAATLTEEERELGVVLADIGAGTMDVSIYLEGSVWHTAVIPLGGWHITNDVAIGLRVPVATAEELKIDHGQAFQPYGAPSELIEVRTFGRSESERIDRGYLCEIIEARVQEILAHLQAEIKRSGYDGLLPAGVVLCGGTAELRGLEQMASEVLQMPVRLGRPGGVGGLVDALHSPAYATAVGLLLWGAEAVAQPHPAPAARKRPTRPREAEAPAPGGVVTWLKRAFFS